MNNDINKIFSNTSCPSEDMLLRYVEGTLSETEKRKIEEHLTDCEMCNDEVEGLMLLDEPSKISSIEAEINTKIDILIRKEKKTNFKFFFKIAASIVLIFGLGTLMYFQLITEKQLDIAENTDVGEIITEKDNNIIDSAIALKKDEIIQTEGASVVEETPSQEQKNINIATGMSSNQPNTVYVSSDISYYEDVLAFAPVEQIDEDGKMTESEVTDNLEEAAKDDDIREERTTTKTADIVPISLAEKIETTAASGKKKSPEKEKDDKNRRKETASQSVPPLRDTEPANEVTGTNGWLVSGDNENNIQELELALENINNNNYNIALQLLESPKLKDSKDETVLYYNALCHYKLNNFQRALSIFKEIKNSQSTLKHNIQWYYALTLIALDKKNDAKKQLEIIINSTSPFATEAQKELDRME